MAANLRAPNDASAGSFGKHHGKSQSHMVSWVFCIGVGWGDMGKRVE